MCYSFKIGSEPARSFHNNYSNLTVCVSKKLDPYDILT